MTEQMLFLTAECDDARVLLTAAAGRIEAASVIAIKNNQYELDKVLSAYRDAVLGMSRMLISLPRCVESGGGFESAGGADTLPAGGCQRQREKQ